MKKGTTVAIGFACVRFNTVLGFISLINGSMVCALNFTAAGFCLGLTVATIVYDK